MYEVPSKTRHEIKFVANFYTLPKIVAWIESNPHGFFKQYPDRLVNNVYFDTFDYLAYSSNLSGSSSRQKVRYRWYGNEFMNKGQLEVKYKRNIFGWKKTYPISKSPFLKNISWRQIIKNIDLELPTEAKHILKFYNFPVISNSYSRCYYISNNQLIRITIDTNQITYDQRYKLIPNLNKQSKLLNTFVMEVKFDRSNRDVVTDFLNGLPIRVSRHSKYMNSLNSVSGRGYV